MPVCKNCKNRIEKFNKDRCPICGQVNPFEGAEVSETVDITTALDVASADYHPRKKRTMLLMFIFLGFFGVPFFYIYQKKMGIIYAIINLGCIALFSFLFAFYGGFLIGVAIAISVAILFALNVGVGLFTYRIPNAQDGHGEFII